MLPFAWCPVLQRRAKRRPLQSLRFDSVNATTPPCCLSSVSTGRSACQTAAIAGRRQVSAGQHDPGPRLPCCAFRFRTPSRARHRDGRSISPPIRHIEPSTPFYSLPCDANHMKSMPCVGGAQLGALPVSSLPCNHRRQRPASGCRSLDHHAQ